MPHYEESPYKTLWQHHFPFEYWYNRLEKINPHNDADRLEALYSLVDLTEIYSRAFSAAIQNPTHPWYYLDEQISVSDVNVAFDALQNEERAVVGRVSGGAKERTAVNAEDDLSLDEIDALTVSLLGVPYDIDNEGTVEIQESPTLHRGICNAILQAAERQVSLQQGFRQGFRVLPVSPDTVETVIDSAGILGEEDREPFQSQMEALRERHDKDRWPLTFIELKRETAAEGSMVQLRVFHVDAWSCYKFAEVVLDALFNLVLPGPGVGLQGSVSEVPVDVLEGESDLSDLIFGVETPVQGQPVRVVTEEILEQNS